MLDGKTQCRDFKNDGGRKMKTGRYSISELLNSNEIGQIIIPVIQRDYVWGVKNVKSLLNSIYSNFQARENLKLDIRLEGTDQSIEIDLKKFLTKEYNKLHFNTRIGFIYAYHNADYENKYFLIDGQQRITTIYLMLLAAYKKTEQVDVFKKRYFIQNEPKIDYQVRETSHDFMIDFINFELNIEHNLKPSFDYNSHYYEIYSKDKTAKTLLNNYKMIVEYMDDKNIVASEWIDYLENYIEFNYFDTNISEQGERLYLYMNSRGESLSDQELVKSEIVGRSQDKLKAGKLWEEWQNFFWKNRHNNVNADKGFLEFLKWSVILHMDCYPNSIKKDFGKIDGKTQSETERKEDYIKQTTPEEQSDWIRQYIIENENFDIDWLLQMMNSVFKLNDYVQSNSEYNFIPKNWLEEVINASDYSPICGCLQYLMNNPDIDNINLCRMGMYIKNLCSGFNNRRNPDNTVLRVLSLIRWMKDQQIIDVRQLRIAKCSVDDDNVYRKDDFRFDFFEKENFNSEKWENFFWSITNNKDLNRFLRGNHDFIIRLLGEKATIESSYDYLDLFKKKVFNKVDSDDLRRELLQYGDISVNDNGGSTNHGPWMERWNLLCKDKDQTNWNTFFNKKQDNNREYEYPKAVSIIRNYLDNKTELKENKPTYLALGDCIEYMEQKKYLWKEENNMKSRCIILKSHQASTDKSCELPVYILHKHIEGSWIWSYNYCVINFDVQDHKIIKNIERNKGYFIDFWYDWHEQGGSWFCRIGHKEHALSQDFAKFILSSDNHIGNVKWKEDTNEYLKVQVDQPIFQEKVSDDLLDSERSVKDWFDSLWNRLSEYFSLH